MLNYRRMPRPQVERPMKKIKGQDNAICNYNTQAASEAGS